MRTTSGAVGVVQRYQRNLPAGVLEAVFYLRDEALRRQVCGPSTMRDQMMAKGADALAYTSTDLVTVFLDDEQAVRAHRAKHAVLARLAWDEDRSREAFVRMADG